MNSEIPISSFPKNSHSEIILSENFDIHQSVTTREVMEGANSQNSVSTVTKKKRMSVKIMKNFTI